jgi:hypothetical protein
MSTAKRAGRSLARARGHVTRVSASVYSGAVLCGYGVFIIVLAAYERLRYGRQRDASVYPGLLPVRTRGERRDEA